MKIPSPLTRLKSIKKHLKGARLIMALVFITVLVVGAVSVSAYTNLQKKKQPVVEQVQSNSPSPTSKVEPQPAVAEEKPVASNSASSATPNSTAPERGSAAAPVAKQTVKKPRPHTSEDPAFVICTQKYSELYVKYNVDLDRINAEKNLALATIDELYNSGYYTEMDPIVGEPYNQWQVDRAELVVHYNNRLAELNSTHEANSSIYLNC
jgi:hypothetical protein